VKADDTSGHRTPEWGSVSAETAAALNAAPRRRADRDGRLTALRLLEAPRRGWVGFRIFRRNRPVHHARLSLSRRRRDADEFSSATLDLVHAGVRFLWT
jgi:hypothetical protein